MKTPSLRHLAVPLFLLSFAACGGDTGFGTFVDSNNLAVDSTNDRLFVTEPGGELFVMTASTREPVAEDPLLVDEDLNADISALMPSVVAKFAVYPNGASSRLFLMGAFADDSGNLVTNRVRVIDFDGTTFSQPSFSPIVLSDGDDATDETIAAFPSLLVDPATTRLYVTDADAGRLYVLSAADGTQVTAPVAIAGAPQGLSLHQGRLYVCNASETEAEQLVTVVNVSDFSTTTIDLDTPCNKIAVRGDGNGTLLIARSSDRPQVLIRRVDTSTYASSSAVTTSTEGLTSGVLVPGAGITSAITGIVFATAPNSLLYAYLPERDGNIEAISFSSDLSSYGLTTLSTLATDIGPGDLLTATDGTSATAYFAATSGYLVTLEVGTDEVDLDN